MIILGIDPGQTGAVVAIECGGPVFYDTPVATFKKSGGGNKTDFLPANMANVLREYAPSDKLVPPNCHVFIEQVGGMPGQGVTSMFGFGKGYGIWIGILAALQIPYTFVTPQRWKKEFMLGKSDKDDARIRAIELFPRSADSLGLKKHIGRADALLIAEWGRRELRRTGGDV
jgi:crossover junction endodeoxyribonuclease RuvC